MIIQAICLGALAGLLLSHVWFLFSNERRIDREITKRARDFMEKRDD